MNPNIRIAVEAIYVAFRVPKPLKIEGCPCCIEGKETDVLLSKPLRSLTDGDLTSYASSVFLTVGCLNDFLYLLPRILEILVESDGWWPSVEVIARAITNGDFVHWPEARKKAVITFFDQVLKTLVEQGGSGFDLDAWICALGNLRLDLLPYLSLIRENPQLLITFYEVNSSPLQHGKLANGFWDNVPEEENRVVNWFKSDDTRDKIAIAYGLA